MKRKATVSGRFRTSAAACAAAVLACAAPAPVVAAAPQADARAEAVLERYLDAVGGREVWAAGAGEYVLAKVSDPRSPLPATFEFCWSWRGPDAADRTRFQGLTQIRVLKGDEGWTYMKPSGPAPGQVAEWDGARVARGLAEWRGNFEALTHRMAARNPSVSVAMGEDDRADWLEISVDGEIAAYLLVDETGAPKRFHRLFDDIRVEFGPMAERGRLNFPAWGVVEGGEPFELIAFEILDDAPTAPFIRPGTDDAGYWECR